MKYGKRERNVSRLKKIRLGESLRDKYKEEWREKERKREKESKNEKNAYRQRQGKFRHTEEKSLIQRNRKCEGGPEIDREREVERN